MAKLAVHHRRLNHSAHGHAAFQGLRGQHADSEADIERTHIIEAHGYTVIRFWNNEVLSSTDGVLLSIAEALAAARNRRDWFEEEG